MAALASPPATTDQPNRPLQLRLAMLLLCLVLAVLLPALGIGTAGIWHVVRDGKAEAQSRLSDTAQALTLAVDREITGGMAALEALAASPALHPDPKVPDLPEFYAHARRVAEQLDTAVVLARRDGTPMLNTRRPLGEPVPVMASTAMIERVFQTGRPAVGDLVHSPLTGNWVVSAAVPVKGLDGHVTLALVRVFDVEKLRGLFLTQRLPPDSFAGMVDSQGLVVMRTDALQALVVGRPAPPENIRRYAQSEAGITRSGGLDGIERVYAFNHVPSAPGWTVVVARSAMELNAAWYWPLLMFGGGSALALGSGLWLAYLAGRRILIPLQQLNRHARAVAASEGRALDEGDSAARLPRPSVIELDNLRHGFAAAENALRRRADAERTTAAALADSDARFRAITNAMPQMVWSARADGYHDYFNQRWYDLTGTTPSGKENDGWIAAFHPDDQPRARARWQYSLNTGELYENECRLRMADGDYRWMLGRARPIHDTDTGVITRWFGTCTDIEETVAARQTLARSREELEQLVETRTNALQEAQSQLAQRQRMEALGQLAGGIAHDFNNVLQAVQGGGALIERRPADPAGVRRLARLVIDAAARGSAITQRLLAFSHRSELRAEPVDPAALLLEMKEILAHTLGAGLVVQVDVALGLPPALADKAQLETVLINLATNARDAMSGMGTLTLAAAAGQQQCDAGPHDAIDLKAGSYLRLAVSDTGSGMTPEVLARVTEPFFTTKAAGKGTGLGLSMARGFAEQSGGGLHIRSAPGQGTTVELWLPAAKGPAAGASSAACDAVSTLKDRPIRLLLVDDEAIVRMVLAEQIEDAGCSVLTAGTPEAALAYLDANEAVDLIITDLSMPGMDGVTLIQEAQKRRPRLPAIILTGYATNATEIAVGGAVNGAFTLLRKPIDGDALVERAAMLLESMPALR